MKPKFYIFSQHKTANVRIRSTKCKPPISRVCQHFWGYQLQGFTAVVIAVVCNTYRFCILVFVACRTVVATFSFLSNDDGLLLLRDLQLSMKNNKHVEGATLAAKICSKQFHFFCILRNTSRLVEAATAFYSFLVKRRSVRWSVGLGPTHYIQRVLLIRIWEIGTNG